MIPSSPKRMWTFLVLTLIAFYLPSWLTPTAWQTGATYLLWNTIYQLLLVLLGFWYDPALCRSMVIRRLIDGDLHARVQAVLAELRSLERARHLPALPVLLFEHPASFVLTIGLLPRRSEVFVASGLVQALGTKGLRFLLARAMAHGKFAQRLIAVLPILAFTLMPGMPANWREGLSWAAFLGAWLALHWLFELLADRAVARAVGADAAEGLREVLLASPPLLGRFSLHPPLRWRLSTIRIANLAA